ncbi:hypothetical protein DPMN_027137 [Dreissena polymorpha]|uniref:VIT domain-containing protein n=1 Tax=Dreissena polymorpha TaxID=45954 RepID=A0A9D4LUR3_DREPO|nr:hypothetical protein DPMN_027137 [Dreissena polymorpha]
MGEACRTHQTSSDTTRDRQPQTTKGRTTALHLGYLAKSTGETYNYNKNNIAGSTAAQRFTGIIIIIITITIPLTGLAVGDYFSTGNSGYYLQSCRDHSFGDITLKSVETSVTIKDCIADVVATLKYNNDESAPIYTVFTFPLGDTIGLYGFEASIDDRKIVTEVQEKNKVETSTYRASTCKVFVK